MARTTLSTARSCPAGLSPGWQRRLVPVGTKAPRIPCFCTSAPAGNTRSSPGSPKKWVGFLNPPATPERPALTSRAPPLDGQDMNFTSHCWDHWSLQYETVLTFKKSKELARTVSAFHAAFQVIRSTASTPRLSQNKHPWGSCGTTRTMWLCSSKDCWAPGSS